MTALPLWKPEYWSALIVLIFVLIFASDAAKPLLLDNAEFPPAAAQTAISGVPVYYHGEAAHLALGLFHPPLYIYLLAAWIKIFGFGETQVRMFGMVCALLLGWVTLELLAALLGREKIASWRPWFWLIFLLNPYTIQGASIADIDSTIYGPLLCAVLVAVVRLSWRDGEWRTDAITRGEYALVVAALTLCLWSKLTTVLLIFPFIFFLLIPRLTVGRAALTSISLVSASVAAFLITYYSYGKLTGLNVNFTFAFTWMSFTVRGVSGGHGLGARLADFRRNGAFMIPFMVRWTGLAPWIAGIAVVCSAFWRAVRKRDARAAHAGLLMLLAFATTGYYCIKVATFGMAPFKYVFVYWGIELAALVMFAFSGDELWSDAKPRALSNRNIVMMVALLMISAVFSEMKVGDHLMLINAAGSYVWVALIPALLLIVGIAARRMPLGKILLGAAFSVYCGVQFGVALAQSKVDYATTYDYGERGFEDVVAFLRENTAPGDVISSMKDVGFSTHRKYYENYLALYADDKSEAALIDAIESGKIVYEVFTEGRGQDQLAIKPSLSKWVAEHCELVRSFGNYRIYKYKTQGAK